jgi:DNA polymerase III subunit delta
MKEAEKLLLDLKRRIFKPVYFLFGEEPFYIDQVSDYIEEHVLTPEEREFNQDVVYGKDTTLSAVIGLAKQYPMLSEWRVVMVKEAQDLRDLSKKGDDSEDAEPAPEGGVKLLQAYLSKPVTSTLLVFCYKHKPFDKRTSLAKALQKHAVWFETKSLYDNQLPQWITDYVKTVGMTINPRASFMMAEFLGNDLSRIANEISKLVISMKPGEEISPALVQEKIGISKEYSVFELQDALSAKDVMKANRIVSYFAANPKENPIVLVLATLYSYFTKVLRFHFLPDKSKFAAAQSLGVNPFFVDGYARAASNYSTGKLKNVFSSLKECDLRSKGIDNSSVSDGELLKELVYKILH